MSSRSGWYDVSKVSTRNCSMIQSNIDAVFADNIEEAVTLASLRNGLRPGEQFGVRKSRGIIGIKQSVSRHNRRTAQIEQFTELIEQNG